MKSPVRAFIWSASLAFLVGLIWFALSMEVHDKFYRPTTFDGKPVVRYGFSRLHSTWHFNAKTGVGDVIQGRCFVEYMEDSGVRRESAWILQREVDRDGRAARISILR